MDFSSIHFISSLLVFKNTFNQELIRSLHVYKVKDFNYGECTKEIEREFHFSENGSYVELMPNPCLTLPRFPVSQVVEGQLMGIWFCMFSFHADGHPQYISIPPILSVSRNPKLMAVPNLVMELEMIFQWCPLANRGEASQAVLSTGFHRENEENKKPQASRNRRRRSRRNRMLKLDLNYSPDHVGTSDQLHKQKRASPKDIANLTPDDLNKYFELPIAEASKQLKVGLTVLKKKCREFGIPRWPHRKIKSLDGLIQDLQKESKHHQEDRAAAVALARRQKKLEDEKEAIERKPSVDMQGETKKFRQDVFKKRHKAKTLQIQG